jgi:DNA-binding response OmpR family regulator
MMPRHVLIIEDDPTLLRGLRDRFESQGFHVTTETDGESGLRAATGRDFDLIVLDVMLPLVNGFEVCLRLRRQRIESPILLLTARGSESDVVHGLELGADDYVTKPFRARELLARARALLRRTERIEGVICFGDVRFDPDARRLWRGGEEIPLTSKESRVLEYLLRNEGRPLTRDRILNAAWGPATFVTPRSVDRCITTLRAKIEADPRQPAYIQTIRDVGYRFERGLLQDLSAET